MPTGVRDQVFISYSHKDTAFLNELLVHLKPLERLKLVSAWSDTQIVAGSQWFAQIKAALARTKVAVLLVSPNFLASDFINQHELGPLLQEVKNGGVVLLCVPIDDCNHKHTALNDLQWTL